MQSFGMLNLGRLSLGMLQHFFSQQPERATQLLVFGAQAGAQGAAHDAALGAQAGAQGAAHDAALGAQAGAQGAAHEAALGAQAGAQGAAHEAAFGAQAGAQGAAHEAAFGAQAGAHAAGAEHDGLPNKPADALLRLAATTMNATVKVVHFIPGISSEA